MKKYFLFLILPALLSCQPEEDVDPTGPPINADERKRQEFNEKVISSLSQQHAKTIEIELSETVELYDGKKLGESLLLVYGKDQGKFIVYFYNMDSQTSEGLYTSYDVDPVVIASDTVKYSRIINAIETENGYAIARAVLTGESVSAKLLRMEMHFVNGNYSASGVADMGYFDVNHIAPWYNGGAIAFHKTDLNGIYYSSSGDSVFSVDLPNELGYYGPWTGVLPLSETEGLFWEYNDISIYRVDIKDSEIKWSAKADFSNYEYAETSVDGIENGVVTFKIVVDEGVNYVDIDLETGEVMQ